MGMGLSRVFGLDAVSISPVHRLAMRKNTESRAKEQPPKKQKRPVELRAFLQSPGMTQRAASVHMPA
jgi:hypothetical protein